MFEKSDIEVVIYSDVNSSNGEEDPEDINVDPFFGPGRCLMMIERTDCVLQTT